MMRLPMKIGIFSDVHGHLAELKRTLALFAAQEVDEILCGGDLVDKGLHSDAVVQTLRARSDIYCVQGNHDSKAVYTWSHFMDDLQEDTLDYLMKLPKERRFTWAEKSLYLTHSNPWYDSSIYIYPERPRQLLAEVLYDAHADIVILGHTHHPMYAKIGQQVLINSGSIYGNRDRNERTCGILHLPDCRFDLYDIDTDTLLETHESP